MYQFILKYVRAIGKWKNVLILVNAHPKNEEQVWKLLEKVENETQEAVNRITWWNELSIATIFVNPMKDELCDV